MALKGQIQFQKKLDRVAIVAERVKLWGRIGFQAIDIITQRTLKGKDYKGAPFTAYSEKYGRWKKARALKPGSNVNLHLKGHMMSSLKPKATAKNVTLFFSKPQEAKKAFIHHKGKGKMPKREFFDLSKMERKHLGKLMAKELRKAANG